MPAARRWPSQFRVKPSALIIGAQKGGTTSLFHTLTQHPRIAPPRHKELDFFGKYWHKGPAWYARRFPRRSPFDRTTTSIDASPAYLIDPRAPARAAALLPTARIVAILREPGARALSLHHHNIRRGRPGLAFETAIETERRRLPELLAPYEQGDTDDIPREAFFVSLLTGGHYADHLERWLEHFPPHQLLILHAESFYADPQAATRHAADALGLEPHTINDTSPQNTGGPRDTLDPDTRARLDEHFAPHNARLANLITKHQIPSPYAWPDDGSWPQAQPHTLSAP